MSFAAHLPASVQLPALAAHHNRRVVYSLFVFTASAASIGLITAVAYLSGHPLIVPSLGPTAFLVFNRSESSVARPRNIILGHLTGVIAGFVALVVFGLQHAPSVVEGGLSSPRIGAAALSVAMTSAVMILLRAEHGPALATTLIISLGFMTTPISLGLLMSGVVALAVLGVLIDRFVGLKMPVWSNPGFRESRHRFHDTPWVPSQSFDTVHTNGHDAVPDSLTPASPRRRPAFPSWVIASDEGRSVRVGSIECTIKVQDAHANDSYSLLEIIFDPKDPSTLLHAHYGFSETYFVLEGEVVAEVGMESRRIPEGSTISIPVGIPHVLNAAGRRPARCLCITDRALHSDLEYLP
jgi:mannose-6-phosphate isomerase-like protein (cupin superfamily)